MQRVEKGGDRCKELKAQRSEEGGHHYPIWRLECKELDRDPKRVDIMKGNLCIQNPAVWAAVDAKRQE